MTLTSEELARLRVSLAKLPGLNAAGLFCWDRGESGCCVLEVDNHWVRFAGDDLPNVSTGSVDLDLSDSATADRVARWCAGRVGLEVGCTAPGWRSYSARADPPLAIWLLGEPGDARVFANQPRRDPPLTGWAYSRAVENVVPTLADLDPTDARLLPDGARWIDRLALALVATHLGGLP